MVEIARLGDHAPLRRTHLPARVALAATSGPSENESRRQVWSSMPATRWNSISPGWVQGYGSSAICRTTFRRRFCSTSRATSPRSATCTSCCKEKSWRASWRGLAPRSTGDSRSCCNTTSAREILDVTPRRLALRQKWSQPSCAFAAPPGALTAAMRRWGRFAKRFAQRRNLRKSLRDTGRRRNRNWGSLGARAKNCVDACPIVSTRARRAAASPALRGELDLVPPCPRQRRSPSAGFIARLACHL